MITDQDINKLKKVFITKEDAKKFATKEDLKKYATKKNHSALAERHETLVRYVMEKVATKEDVRVIVQENIADYSNKILTILDGIAKRLDSKDIEDAAGFHRFARHERWIKHIAKKTNVTLPA